MPSQYDTPKGGRPQGSLLGQQRRAISDAVEYMRRCGKNKPLIFVCTSPGFIDRTHECRIIPKFTNNLRQNYGLHDYVWVREFTQHGFPHWHFVADIPRFDVVKMSLYWSGLFGEYAKNSIRLGTKPDRKGKRRFYITTPRMAWYLSKYIGKALSDDEKRAAGTVRTFAISENAGRWSQPVTYSETRSLFTGIKDYVGYVEDPDGIEHAVQFDPDTYDWKPVEKHPAVLTGFKARAKNQKITVESQKMPVDNR